MKRITESEIQEFLYCFVLYAVSLLIAKLILNRLEISNLPFIWFVGHVFSPMVIAIELKLLRRKLFKNALYLERITYYIGMVIIFYSMYVLYMLVESQAFTRDINFHMNLLTAIGGMGVGTTLMIYVQDKGIRNSVKNENE